MYLWKEAVKRERFPHLGHPLHQLGDQQEQKEHGIGSEKSVAANWQQAEHRQTMTGGPGHLPALPKRDVHTPAGVCDAWVLNIQI